MSRELSIRVPPEISVWVRQQPGSVSETAYALARGLYERRQEVRDSNGTKSLLGIELWRTFSC